MSILTEYGRVVIDSLDEYGRAVFNIHTEYGRRVFIPSGEIYLSILESILVGDSRLASMIAGLSRTEGLVAGDIRTPYGILSRLDALKVGDSSLLEALMSLARADGLKLDDTQLADMLASIQRVEGAKIGDTTAILATFSLALTEALRIGDVRALGIIGKLLLLWLSMQTYHDVTLFTKTYHDVIMYTEPYHNLALWTGGEDMSIRRDWQKGETVPIWAEVILASTGALYDPNQGVKLTVTSPITGTKVVDAGTMTKSTVGMYVYYWNSVAGSEVGWYEASGKAQDGAGAGAKITIEHSGFFLQ